MHRVGTWSALLLAVVIAGWGCGGPQGHDGDFVRQGATGLEVEPPEVAAELTRAFDELLDLIESRMDDGDALLTAVTDWVRDNGPAVDEATRRLHHDLQEMAPDERRALEEQLGHHFLPRNLRWRSLRERIAREHPRHSHAITQRVTQLQPDA